MISTFLIKKSKNYISFFQKIHILRALQSPRAFDHRPRPGLSPSPKVGPRALQKTRAPGRARAGPRPGPITNRSIVL